MVVWTHYFAGHHVRGRDVDRVTVRRRRHTFLLASRMSADHDEHAESTEDCEHSGHRYLLFVVNSSYSLYERDTARFPYLRKKI